HAKSITRKQREATVKKETVTQRAIEIYNEEQKKPESEREGLRGCCRAAEDEYFRAKNVVVQVNHNTVNARRKGRKSVREAREDDTLETPGQTKYMLEYLVEVADRGFPMVHRRFRELADRVLKSTLGPDFKGVGENW
ncbi:uncharacterized protein B0H18DRAFT_824336, partial [Fomitopsis serialis]|uniref:uncharacterized protein n=1 Tax=Fomitopsis serialis TaxID=139415 RepID=UPI002007BA0C